MERDASDLEIVFIPDERPSILDERPGPSDRRKSVSDNWIIRIVAMRKRENKELSSKGKDRAHLRRDYFERWKANRKKENV